MEISHRRLSSYPSSSECGNSNSQRYITAAAISKLTQAPLALFWFKMSKYTVNQIQRVVNNIVLCSQKV